MINKELEILKLRFEQNQIICEKVINLFHQLSNKIRFRIVCLLTKGDFCVSDIVEIISCGNLTNISSHLKLLTLAGIISKHREKKHIIYSIKDESVKKLVEYLEAQYYPEEKK